MIKNFGALMVLTLLFFSNCQKDKRIRIFEMRYQNLEFEIPVGYGGGAYAMYFEFPELKTNFQNFLDQNGTDIETIGGIFPLSAKITSFDGNKYYYIQDVEIRVCSPSETNCTAQVDGVFYEEDLNGSADNDIPLAAGLQNVKELMMGEYFRLEVVMTVNQGQITPYNQLSRLDMSFEVVE
jgi:hypothetical protein